MAIDELDVELLPKQPNCIEAFCKKHWLISIMTIVFCSPVIILSIFAVTQWNCKNKFAPPKGANPEGDKSAQLLFVTTSIVPVNAIEIYKVTFDAHFSISCPDARSKHEPIEFNIPSDAISIYTDHNLTYCDDSTERKCIMSKDANKCSGFLDIVWCDTDKWVLTIYATLK